MGPGSHIIGLTVHNLTFQESLQQVRVWGQQHQPGFICFANVHMSIEAYKDPQFQQTLNKASLVLPDGKPLSVACKLLYGKKQERVAGMDFLPALLQDAAATSSSVFLYGSTDEVLQRMKEQIAIRYPQARIAGAISPPFRALQPEETAAHIQAINHSGANYVLVALGCPKQEKWMAAHYTAIQAPLLGLGGAFPVLAGVQKRAPEWMQRLALEWLYRLIQEPKRMFRRYLYTNSLFLWLLLKALITRRSSIRQPKQS